MEITHGIIALLLGLANLLIIDNRNSRTQQMQELYREIDELKGVVNELSDRLASTREPGSGSD